MAQPNPAEQGKGIDPKLTVAGGLAGFSFLELALRGDIPLFFGIVFVLSACYFAKRWGDLKRTQITKPN